MQQLINQYSFVWFTIVFLLVLAFPLSRRKSKVQGFIVWIVVAMGLMFTWRILRPTQTPSLNEAKMVQSLIGQGKPVLLEFQSPY